MRALAARRPNPPVKFLPHHLAGAKQPAKLQLAPHAHDVVLPFAEDMGTVEFFVQDRGDIGRGGFRHPGQLRKLLVIRGVRVMGGLRAGAIVNRSSTILSSDLMSSMQPPLQQTKPARMLGRTCLPLLAGKISV